MLLAVFVLGASTVSARAVDSGFSVVGHHWPEVEDQVKEDATQAEREALERQTPAAIAERLHSREAYADQGDQQAEETLDQQFGETIEALASTSEVEGDPVEARGEGAAALTVPEDAPDGSAAGPEDVGENLAEAVEALDPNASAEEVQSALSRAVTEGNNSEAALADASYPLDGGVGDGEPGPIDLDLNREEDVFRPANPLVDVSMPATLDDGIRLESLEIELQPEGLEPVEGQLTDARTVLYPNAAADTDLLAFAVPTGAEAMAQLRSPASPETFSYSLEIPQGAELREAPGGRIEVHKNGRLQAQIPHPWAIDADDRPVPVQMSLEEETITISVPHSIQDVAYPILLDPVLEGYTWASGTASGLGDWLPQSTAGAPFTTRTSCDASLSCYGTGSSYPGLYIDAPATGLLGIPFTYQPVDQSVWYYTVPRWAEDTSQYGQAPTTHITRFDLSGEQFHRRGDTGIAPYPVQGIIDPQAWQWVGADWLVSDTTQPYNVSILPGRNVANPNTPAGKLAAMYLSMAGYPARQLQARRDLYVGGATLYLEDGEAPTLTGASHTTQIDPSLATPWADQHTDRVTPTARDEGLGIRWFGSFLPDLRDPSGYAWVDHVSSCLGTRQAPCPREGQESFEYNTQNAPEGRSAGGVVGYDALNKPTAAASTWWIRVDRTDPNISVAGQLQDGTGPQLSVSAADGATSSAAAERSGVKSIELLVDGQRAAVTSGGTDGSGFVNQSCDGIQGSCSMVADFVLDMTAYEIGSHDFQAIVTDQVGHRKSETWTQNLGSGSTADGAIKRIDHVKRAPGANPAASSDLASLNIATDLNEWFDGSEDQQYFLDLASTIWAEHPPGIKDVKVNFPGPATPGQASPYVYNFHNGHTGTGGCTAPGSCSPRANFRAIYDVGMFPEGINQVTVDAYGRQDQAIGHADFAIKSDRTPKPGTAGFYPEDSIDVGWRPLRPVGPLEPGEFLEVESGDVLGTGDLPIVPLGTLKIAARDPAPSGADPDLARSGVSSIEVRVDGVRRFHDSAPCPAGNCEMERQFDLRAGDYGAGLHTLEVNVTDHAGHTWGVARLMSNGTGGDASDAASRLGLEQFHHYESIATGAESSAHINLDNGNLAWHKIPLENPGRGLSTVANLTYNSQDRALVPDLVVDLDALDEQNLIDLEQLHQLGLPSNLSVLNLGYEEAGKGVSLGMSGLSRLNEPLGGRLLDPTNPLGLLDPESVQLRDPDGTVHSFKAKLRNDPSSGDPFISYDAPPGVNLHLRRFQVVETDVLESLLDDLTIADLVAAPEELLQSLSLNKAWAITQPSGVTHFFNIFGYQSGIEDRNRNEIRFEYELHSPLTGGSCLGLDLVGDLPLTDLVDLPGICEPRVKRVVDAAGVEDPQLANDRAVAVNYHPGGLIANFQGNAEAGKVAELNDHASRTTTLGYDNKGNLQTIIEGLTQQQETPDDPDARTTTLEYDNPQTAQAPFDYPKLIGVVDPVGNRTSFSYAAGSDGGLGFMARPVSAVDDRRQGEAGRHRLDIAYEASGQSNSAIVTDQRSAQWRYALDDKGRLLQATHPMNISSGLEWDSDNNVISLVKGGNTANPEQATRTVMAYNENGMMTMRRDPLGRTTFFEYENSPGTQLSQYPDLAEAKPSVDSVDEQDNDGFVSDLVKITKPGGNAWSYELDDENDAANVGNVTAEIEPAVDGVAARTEFDFDQFGQTTEKREQYDVADEDEPLFNATRFENYDPSGFPQVVVDPRGTDSVDDDPQAWAGNAHRWVYRYDAVGNLLEVTDPRGARPGGPANQAGAPFQNLFVYDAFDRVRGEYIAKCTDSSNDACRSGQPTDSDPRYITNLFAYNKNGNLTASADGNGGLTQTGFTKTDLPNVEVSAEGEVTTRQFDGVGNLTLEASPRLNVGDPKGPLDLFEYDLAGRLVAEVQKGVGSADLVTSYAYDARDNLIAQASPRRNAGLSVTAAIARVAQYDQPEHRSITYGYDFADQLRADETRPAPNTGGPTDSNVEANTYNYDLNGNLVSSVPVLHLFGLIGDPAKYRRYNERDELVEIADGLAQTTRYERRLDGRVTTATSPRGVQSGAEGDFETRYEYLPTGEIASRSVPYDIGQYGKSEDELKAAQVTYQRDPAGHPAVIRDAVGNVAAWEDDTATAAAHTIHNTFYDTGEVRTTNRPSWWSAGWQGGAMGMIPDPGNAYRIQDTKAGAEPDLAMPVDGPVVAEKGAGATIEVGQDPLGGELEPSQPEAPGDFGRVGPEALPALLPRAGNTEFAYDDAGRLRAVKPADGEQTEIKYDQVGRVTRKETPFMGGGSRIEHLYSYDPNGNLKTFDDGVGHWDFSFDEFDRLSEEKAPGAASSIDDQTPAGPEVSRFSYDESGNLRFLCLPGHQYPTAQSQCPLAQPGQGNFFEYQYDSADDLILERNPAGETYSYRNVGGEPIRIDDPRGTGTLVTYDALERRVSSLTTGDPVTDTVEPGQSVLMGATMISEQSTFDADGNVASQTRSGYANDLELKDQVVRQEFDGQNLLSKSTTGSEAYDDSSHLGDRRTTITEHDPNGNPIRTLNPAAVDAGDGPRAPAEPNDSAFNSTVREYDSDNLLREIHLPWEESDEVPSDTDEEIDEENVRKFQVQIRHDPLGRVRAIRHAHVEGADEAPTTCYQHFPSNWISSSSDEETARNDFEGGGCPGGVNQKRFSYTYDERGNQRSWSASLGGRSRTVDRHYFPNGLLQRRQAAGNSSGTNNYRYFYSPNRSLIGFGAGQDGALQSPTAIQRDGAERETFVDSPNPNADTQFIYNSAGDLTERRTGSNWTRTMFSYDALGRAAEMRVDPAEAGLADHTTRSSYYPTGELARRIEWRDNGDAPELEAGEYYTPGELEQDADVVEQRFYNSDGQINRMRRRSEGASSDYKNQRYLYDKNGNRIEDERGSYAYNARNQLTRWDRRANQPKSGSVAYQLDGDGDIKVQTDSGVPANEQKSCHRYDQNASDQVEKVIEGPLSLDCSAAAPDGFRETTYGYDPFGNVQSIHATQDGATPVTSTYSYDDFGRRLSADPDGPAEAGGPLPGESYDYDALDRRNSKTVNGASRSYGYLGTSELLAREVDPGQKSYDYDSRGQRQGQVRAGSYQSYAHDVQGSVEGLETDQGEVPPANRYHYDPYGDLECIGQANCDDTLGENLKENPFRFQGFYYDSGVKTYDLQARDYRPDVGRFLNEDRYESAGLDLQLQSDPLTQNRYAFAGGNPVSNTEFDGHNWEQAAIHDKYGGGARGVAASRRHTVRSNQQIYHNPQGIDYSGGAGAPASPDRIVESAHVLRVAVAEHLSNPTGNVSEADYRDTSMEALRKLKRTLDSKPAIRSEPSLSLDEALAGCSGIPAVGGFCDAGSGIKSAIQGDWVGVGLSASGIFFEGSSFAKAARTAKMTDEAAMATSKVGPRIKSGSAGRAFGGSAFPAECSQRCVG